MDYLQETNWDQAGSPPFYHQLCGFPTCFWGACSMPSSLPIRLPVWLALGKTTAPVPGWLLNDSSSIHLPGPFCFLMPCTFQRLLLGLWDSVLRHTGQHTIPSPPTYSNWFTWPSGCLPITGWCCFYTSIGSFLSRSYSLKTSLDKPEGWIPKHYSNIRFRLPTF